MAPRGEGSHEIGTGDLPVSLCACIQIDRCPSANVTIARIDFQLIHQVQKMAGDSQGILLRINEGLFHAEAIAVAWKQGKERRDQLRNSALWRPSHDYWRWIRRSRRKAGHWRARDQFNLAWCCVGNSFKLPWSEVRSTRSCDIAVDCLDLNLTTLTGGAASLPVTVGADPSVYIYLFSRLDFHHAAYGAGSWSRSVDDPAQQLNSLLVVRSLPD